MSTNYEQFIAANQALIDCYAQVSAEQFSALSRQDQQNVCRSESTAVRGFLENDSPNFKNILADRIRAYDAKPAESE